MFLNLELEDIFLGVHKWFFFLNQNENFNVLFNNN